MKAGALDQFKDRKVLWDNVELLMDWIKTSANADQGLFGGMETFISLKQTTPSTLMERLMMEQEVFKAFISGNPLDGLYKYIKKFSFLSQVIAVSEYPHFEIIGYISEIKRAKKKGVFVKIADITADFEIFLQDTCGLQQFDLLIVTGAKKCREKKENGKVVGKNSKINIYKIIKTSHDMLKTLAGSSYDPSQTVVEVKKLRYGEDKLIKQQELTPIDVSKTTPLSVEVQGNEDGHLISESEEIVADTQILEQEIEAGNGFEDIETGDVTAEDLEEMISNGDETLIDEEEKKSVDCVSKDTDEESDIEEETREGDSHEGEGEDGIETSDNPLLDHAKDLLNEIIDVNRPIRIESSQLKTIAEVQEVVQLIKNNPGTRTAIILGKEVQISEYAIEVLKKYVEL
ncbi:MAG: hypothetical protein LBD11_06945 [Candidatus Peribacteria bacterium]|nr:hypothetical protein [Candidatus Peribacteria bacterium]